MIGTIMPIRAKTIIIGIPIIAKIIVTDKKAPIPTNNHITNWNNNAWMDNLLTSSSPIKRKNSIGTKHGAKNALACKITFNPFASNLITHFQCAKKQKNIYVIAILR